MTDLKNKTAIITGASRGIGKAIAYSLGKKGVNIVITSRNIDDLKKVVLEFEEEDINCMAIASHNGKIADLSNLVDETVKFFGGIDILINNAATNPHFGPIETITPEAYNKIMEINVFGPFELARLALPHLKKNGGSIVNISSVEGLTPSEGMSFYSLSKSALISLTKSQALEWAKFNIRSNAVCPGLIKTEFSKVLWTNDKIMKYIINKIPMRRAADSSEVSGLVSFLASDSSSYCTGGIYKVDGGLTI